VEKEGRWEWSVVAMDWFHTLIDWTFSELFALSCGIYLVQVLFFAMFYFLIGSWKGPDACHMGNDADTPAKTFLDCLYFSLETMMTSAGYHSL
jgi:hypothetical protein